MGKTSIWDTTPGGVAYREAALACIYVTRDALRARSADPTGPPLSAEAVAALVERMRAAAAVHIEPALADDLAEYLGRQAATW